MPSWQTMTNWMVREQGSPSNFLLAFLSPAMGISHDSEHFSLSRTMRVASTARVNHSFSFMVSYLNKCKDSQIEGIDFSFVDSIR